MVSSLFAIEQAAREDALVPALEVLLDELESIGALGGRERIEQVRARVLLIGRQRAAVWAQQPDTAIVDLYARTLELAELDAVRPGWIAALDARGPWLRPLRPQWTDAAVVAELRAGPKLPLGRVRALSFASDTSVVLALGEDDGACTWAWTRGRVDAGADAASIPPRVDDDPRFELGEDPPRFRTSPSSEARALPWPEIGRAGAQLSADGRTIFVYGWYDDGEGLLRVVDAQSLAVLAEHEFERTVSQVLERPGSDDLLVVTYGELVILTMDTRTGVRAPSWRWPWGVMRVAWSPSGRYLCTAGDSAARIIDTHADTPMPQAARGGLPVSFSSDGARLVDGAALLDGHTGAQVGTLKLRLGAYLEGGPASPWFHVGTELIVCIHGGLQVFDARSGARLDAGRLMVPHWEHIAYARSGRVYARGRGHAVTLGVLPSAEELGSVDFELDIEALALSADGERIAAYGGGRIEVRDRHGRLICVDPSTARRETVHGALVFSADERALIYRSAASTVSSRNADGEWVQREIPSARLIWDISGDRARPRSDIDEPTRTLPAGWRVEPGSCSVFVHEGGARIVVPHGGPWTSNPANARLLACPGGLFELRG